MRSEERRNISLDFERRFRAAVVTTIMNKVSALSHEALDCVVARRDGNAHDFRELSVRHEICREVGQRSKAQSDDAFDVRFFQRLIGLDFSNSGVRLHFDIFGSDTRLKSLNELLKVRTFNLRLSSSLSRVDILLSVKTVITYLHSKDKITILSNLVDVMKSQTYHNLHHALISHFYE